MRKNTASCNLTEREKTIKGKMRQEEKDRTEIIKGEKEVKRIKYMQERK
jgi:hypothetical protein